MPEKPEPRFDFTDPMREWLASRASFEVESHPEALLDAALSILIGQHQTILVRRQVKVQMADGKIGRIDFRLDYLGGSIYVEVDGRPWHERLPEQAENDRQRDRYLASIGMQPLRFMAAEVHRNAFGCAEELIRRCLDLQSSSAPES